VGPQGYPTDRENTGGKTGQITGETPERTPGALKKSFLMPGSSFLHQKVSAGAENPRFRG